MSARKIAYNTIAQVGGKFLGFFISSFFLIILASNLGTEGMGYYTTVTAFVAFFVNVADLGLSIVMMREIAQNPERKEEITGDFLGFRFAYSLILMALAPFVAMLFPQYGTIIVYGVAIAALAQFLLLVNQTFVSVLQVSLQLDRAVFAEIINRAVTLGLVVYAARTATDPTNFFFTVMWITVAAAVVNTALSYYFARKWWAIRPRFDSKRWKQILLLVIPMGIFSFLSMVHFKSDTIILSLLKPAYDVGIYGYAYKIGEIMFSIPMMFIGIVFPRMSALFKSNNEEFLGFCQRIFEVLLFVSVPFITGVYLLAPYLTTLLSRQSVTDGLIAGDVLRILSFAMIAWFFGAMFQHILLAGTEYKGLVRNLSVAVVLNIALNFILIPTYSYFAAASITVFTEVIMLVLTMVYVYKKTGFLPKLVGIVPVVVASFAMYGAVRFAAGLIAPDIPSFAAADRFYQLIALGGLGAIGGLVYTGVTALWGKSSPLYTFFKVLRKS